MSNINLWTIYSNLFILIDKRGWVKKPEQLEKTEFELAMRSNGYVYVTGINRYSEPATIVLTDIVSHIANHTNEFTNAMGKLKGDIMLISNKQATNQIKQYATTIGLKFSSYTFGLFAIDMTKASMVPPHRIMSKEEIKELFQFTASERADLPKIFINDTQIIWLGARIGDVIEVTRSSEATGYAIIHRVVTHPM